MGDKSIQKKRYIIEKAALVFAEKGYKNVTMKDIVEACDISRGGLYLYFNSTKEIFEAVLEDARTVSKPMEDEAWMPGDKLLAFLEEKKQAIVGTNDKLGIAVYEYQFEHRGTVMSILDDFDSDLHRLEEIIEEGVATDWMVCEEPKAAARSILYTLEGLKVSAKTRVVTPEMVDEEIEYMMGTLGLALE